MAYVDGFVAPVLPGRKDDYRTLCRAAAAIFLEHGALQVVECYGDDVPHGTMTDLWRAVQATDDEGLVFSWIAWPSRAARDAGWE